MSSFVGSSSPYTISRPKTYDPSLAARAEVEFAAEKRKAEEYESTLKADLGFSSDEDVESGGETGSDEDGDSESDEFDENEEGFMWGDEHRTSPSAAARKLREEYKQLQKRYMVALKGIHGMGEEARKAKESLEKMRRMSKSQVTIMSQNFATKIKATEESSREMVRLIHAYEKKLQALGHAVDEPQAAQFKDAVKRRKNSAFVVLGGVESSEASDNASKAKHQEPSISTLTAQMKSMRTENKVLQRALADLALGKKAFLSIDDHVLSSKNAPKASPMPQAAEKKFPATPKNSKSPESAKSEAETTPVEFQRKYRKAKDVARSCKKRLARSEKDKQKLLSLLKEAKQKLDQRSPPGIGDKSATSADLSSLRKKLVAAESDSQNLRLQLLQTSRELEKTKDALSELAETANAGQEAKIEDAENKKQLSEDLERAQIEMKAFAEKASGKIEELKKSKKHAVEQVKVAKAKIKKLKMALEASSTSKGSMESGLEDVRAQTRRLKKNLRKMLEDAQSELESCKASFSKQVSRVASRASRMIGCAVEKYKEEAAERKRLFNLVQELRGNIRVYCRVRPLLAFDKGSTAVSYPDEDAIAMINSKGREKTWEFDKVFQGSKDNNTSIFGEVSELCTSVFDGYNVCIFAYGQTGSGKTHTMEGEMNDRGINYRALQLLFENVAQKSDEFEVRVTLTLLEIYNEKIRDLLTAPSNKKHKKLEVKQGPNGMYVPNLTTVEVNSHGEVDELLSLAKHNRATASTDLNERSSRSHCMLSIYLSSRNKLTGEEARGKLHLVDLAGSERVHKSNAQGARMKEAQNINRSLSSLGDVIQARSMKQGHVPFRNSTLTYLLQDSLSNDSKTLMIVTVSPTEYNSSESFCSLNFASRVRTVELGKAKKHVSKGN